MPLNLRSNERRLSVTHAAALDGVAMTSSQSLSVVSCRVPAARNRALSVPSHGREKNAGGVYAKSTIIEGSKEVLLGSRAICERRED